MSNLTVRAAIKNDLEAVAAIYNQGINERIATLETRKRSVKDIESWLERPRHPLLVADKEGQILGWISASEYRPRDCYAGIVEFSIYIGKNARGQGVGNLLMPAFFEACAKAGVWKILSRIFPENKASLSLCKKHGFREVGIYENHAKLDGVWRNVVIVEKLLETNLT